MCAKSVKEEYEEELCVKEENDQQRQTLDVVFKQPQYVFHTDSLIKEEEQQTEIIKFPLIGVVVKTEAGEDQGQRSSLHPSQSKEESWADSPDNSVSHRPTEVDGDRCGASHSDRLLAPLSDSDDITDEDEHAGGDKKSHTDVDLVADLLCTQFSRRAFHKKLDIVRRGRPTPALAGLSQRGKGFVRHFQTSNYERYPWLTASETHCKLYCWECLLLASDRCGVWSHTGFSNLSCFTKAARKHQSTAGHLQATVRLKTFGDTRVHVQLSEQARREMELHNEKVKKNRQILKRLMDCVMFLGRQELSFRGHDEGAESLNRGSYAELISFLAEHDADLHYHLTTNRVFTGTSGKIQNDLIYAIADVMAEQIKAEIKKAPFVAVMVDEITDAGNAERFSLVLRYMTDAGVKERFVKFEDVTRGKPADDIAALIFRLFEEYECSPDKVVAQCYDGAVVMASGLNGVQAKVKEKAPMALFIHSYAHRLNSVLMQGASKLKECKVFLAILNGLAAFFSRSPKRTKLLGDICKRRFPQLAPTRWQCTSKLVNAVYEKRLALKELFDHILEHHGEYDQDAVLAADGFAARLGDFEFCFLLNVFNGIFEYADVLFGILQTKWLDVQFCMARVNEFCEAVERAREKFGEIYEETERVSGAPSVRGGRGAAQDDPRAHYQRLHTSVLDNILSQIRTRFEDHERLMFLSLLDPQRFHSYRKKFPQTALSSLTQSHGALFDLPRLKTELTVMYGMIDFVGKNPADLHNFLRSKNLSESMGQLYTLACLAVTIPVSAASVERSFSALKRIQTYARNTAGQKRLSALASMSIEKDLLMDLKRTDKLYNRATEVFLRKERRIDFIFK
ncbi:zinc finger MYM-type protein 1-like [Hippocampus zosterae]|uniref:zinc finger MYM-type protein 1-like n=1 Tax=Hippocampus zosterae TaxID=109293 RepID=UPI00223CA860|nr:zinc finger MYM-type protein 1-like [Hippocampus zosterae]